MRKSSWRLVFWLLGLLLSSLGGPLFILILIFSFALLLGLYFMFAIWLFAISIMMCSLTCLIPGRFRIFRGITKSLGKLRVNLPIIFTTRPKLKSWNNAIYLPNKTNLPKSLMSIIKIETSPSRNSKIKESVFY